jgi:hypothetical protein
MMGAPQQGGADSLHGAPHRRGPLPRAARRRRRSAHHARSAKTPVQPQTLSPEKPTGGANFTLLGARLPRPPARLPGCQAVEASKAGAVVGQTGDRRHGCMGAMGGGVRAALLYTIKCGAGRPQRPAAARAARARKGALAKGRGQALRADCGAGAAGAWHAAGAGCHTPAVPTSPALPGASCGERRAGACQPPPGCGLLAARWRPAAAAASG